MLLIQCAHSAPDYRINSYVMGVIVEMHEQELADHNGYELFRRAIMEGDEEAWAEIYTQYRPLLLAWSRHGTARNPAGEQYEDIADRALARAWAALSPMRFAQFPNLAALLAYLRTCVTAAVIDSARAQATRERMVQKLELGVVTTPEQIVLTAALRDELWPIVAGMIMSEQERLVLEESYMLDLPPRAILERHPDLFADIAEVYGAKRNLLNRLHRSQELQRLYREQLVA